MPSPPKPWETAGALVQTARPMESMGSSSAAEASLQHHQQQAPQQSQQEQQQQAQQQQQQSFLSNLSGGGGVGSFGSPSYGIGGYGGGYSSLSSYGGFGSSYGGYGGYSRYGGMGSLGGLGGYGGIGGLGGYGGMGGYGSRYGGMGGVSGMPGPAVVNNGNALSGLQYSVQVMSRLVQMLDMNFESLHYFLDSVVRLVDRLGFSRMEVGEILNSRHDGGGPAPPAGNGGTGGSSLLGRFFWSVLTVLAVFKLFRSFSSDAPAPNGVGGHQHHTLRPIMEEKTVRQQPPGNFVNISSSSNVVINRRKNTDRKFPFIFAILSSLLALFGVSRLRRVRPAVAPPAVARIASLSDAWK